MSSSEVYYKVVDAADRVDLSSTEMLNIITNYLGMQILDEDFLEYFMQEVE